MTWKEYFITVGFFILLGLVAEGESVWRTILVSFTFTGAISCALTIYKNHVKAKAEERANVYNRLSKMQWYGKSKK